MNATFESCLRSWPWAPWLLCGLTLSGIIYYRGWRVLKRRDEHRWNVGKLWAFLAGLATIYLALASPIEPFASFFLQVHMLQHLLLMMVAPPLIWLGTPTFPLLRGLPEPVRVYWASPVLRSPTVRRVFTRLTHPVMAWLLFVAATWIWHLPKLYDLALRSDGWHYVQHACFLGAGLLFWYPVIRPYPSGPTWSRWLLMPYLMLADVQNTILAALLTFSDRVVYPHYAETPRLSSMSALDDQSAAGVLMWVPGSVAFLVPMFAIGIRLFFSKAKTPPRGRIALPMAGPPTRFDALKLPGLGTFLRWRHARLCLQLPLLALAGVVIYDGFTGPQVGAMNLAGVLPWIHWRGLLILALLVMGNVFCMACPFTLPRTLARRWLPTGRIFPRPLRNKWLAVVLLAGFLWAYEAFALWDSPWLTAWIVVAYFVAAFAVDGFFRGGSFCKYVCPIGQFNFVQSLVSPLEVKTLDPALCASCETKDCIRGRDGIPGCELHLYQPRKASNMDCTFCLDCVHACPHDNVGILATPFGAELWRDPHHSGVGRWSKRPDIAALIVVLVFGAFVNAGAMTAPVANLLEGTPTLLTFAIALLAIPFVIVAGVAALSRRLGRLPQTWAEVVSRYAFALVPLGFGMWLTHYSFHFFTSYATIVPTTQRFLMSESPEWSSACCLPTADWLLRLEIVFLDLGLLLSLYSAFRIARSQTPHWLRAMVPWAILMLLLFAAGVWIVFQPMQMRGTMG